MRLKRIAIDWDFKSRLKVCWYVFKALKYIGGLDTRISIYPSNSKGYHLILWTRNKEAKFSLREKLGDDKKRLELDHYHKQGRNTLFHKKKKKNIGYLKKILES